MWAVKTWGIKKPAPWTNTIVNIRLHIIIGASSAYYCKCITVINIITVHSLHILSKCVFQVKHEQKNNPRILLW